MSWSEDSLHRWLATRRKPKGLVGSQGHDAAVLAARPGRSVLCTDACVEGVHYARGESAARVGAKAAARSLSDLAACGAEPQALLLALRAPLETKESHLRALITGVANLGER
ncbi:MAG TPA: AIR synthase related protein, partial [Planctomycetota bacterium]|nr:AIR synthase related protein [Planctomycetota bacterium]